MAVSDQTVGLESAPTLPDELQALRSGDLVGRYTFVGSPDSSRFSLGIVLGSLDDPVLEPHDTGASYLASVHHAAKLDVEYSYFEEPDLNVFDNLIRAGTDFKYGETMLLRNVAAIDSIDEAVERLANNNDLRANELTWQISVAGIAPLARLHRGLYKIGGSHEMNQPARPPYKRTETQMRTDVMSYLSMKAFDAFLGMPTTESTDGSQ